MIRTPLHGTSARDIYCAGRTQSVRWNPRKNWGQKPGPERSFNIDCLLRIADAADLSSRLRKPAEVSPRDESRFADELALQDAHAAAEFRMICFENFHLRSARYHQKLLGCHKK